ncbi:MAG TPA: hypothetical protein VIV06_12590 [Candidatus Limnocylindrales bacterium]
MAIVYLDVDDEITSAAARVRQSKERRVALVLPAGSRLGTSRINFRLLAREAQQRGRQLAIVAPDAPTRALAASAGLPVFGSVFEYEDSVAGSGPGQGGRSGPGRVGLVGAATDHAGGGAPSETQIGPASDPGSGRDPGRTAEKPSARSAAASIPVVTGGGRRGPSIGLALTLMSLLVVLVIGAIAAWTVLPSASVEVVARPETVGPIELTVRADPSVTAPDATADVVSAQRVTFEMTATGDFPATGTKVDETKATGGVRWTNCDPTRSYRVGGGTTVRTRRGVGFTTDETVFLPVAILAGNPPQITCQSRDVGVTAARAGTAGNVGSGEITVVPASYNSVVVRVTNLGATDGGTHTETRIVAEKDVIAALAKLKADLAGRLQSEAAANGSVPAGLRAFPTTATMTDPVPTTDPTTLVDQAIDTFALSSTASGSVTAVDEQAVKALARQRLLANVSADRDLVDGSIEVELGEPSVSGQAVAFPVTARASEIRRLDAVALREAIKGRSLSEARLILEQYGDARIVPWPDWVTTIPSLDFRLDVHVTAIPAATGGGGTGIAPAGSPATSPVPSAGTAPTGSGRAPSPGPRASGPYAP